MKHGLLYLHLTQEPHPPFAHPWLQDLRTLLPHLLTYDLDHQSDDTTLHYARRLLNEVDRLALCVHWQGEPRLHPLASLINAALRLPHLHLALWTTAPHPLLDRLGQPLAAQGAYHVAPRTQWPPRLQEFFRP